MPSFSTDRLSLEPLQPDDLSWFHMVNTDPAVRKYLWDDRVIAESDARDILLQNQQQFTNRGYGLWKICRTQDQQALGYTGLWFFFEEVHPQLLYAILPPFGKKGYATEAARAVMDFAFDSLGFTYLIAATDPPNRSSMAVARRLGMTFWQEKEHEGRKTIFFRKEHT